jgi:transposase-like protein
MLRRGREFWITAIAEFERSKLTHEAFAQRRGFSVETLRSWIYRLRRERQDSMSLVPVRVVESPPPAVRRSSESAAEIEVVLASGVRLRFAMGIDLDYVTTLAERLG